MREPLARFVVARCSYVLNVATYGDLGGEGSDEQALADALLAPLARWQSTGGARRGKGEGEPGDNTGEGAGDE